MEDPTGFQPELDNGNGSKYRVQVQARNCLIADHLDVAQGFLVQGTGVAGICFPSAA